MFKVRAEPLLLSEAGIHGLCVSLNTPVLNIDELPVGPARAAIVLYGSGYGSLGLAVGVRSLETRQVAVFAYNGSIDMQCLPADAMEDATSFAERMGFLFDDDVVAASASESDARARALRLWTELTDAPEADEEQQEPVEPLDELAPPPLSPAVRLEPAPEELVLDDLADLGADLSSPGADELWLEELSEAPPAPAATASARSGPMPSPAAVPSVSLTKFRQPPPQAAVAPTFGTSPSDTGSELGRIPLVRRRPDGTREAPARPGLLLRLLGSF
jgi:hypothetical protein